MDKSTKETRAVKIMNREYYDTKKELKDKLHSAFEVLVSLNHPNVVRTYDIYADPDNYYVVMEFVPGKGALDYVRSLPAITEKIVAGIMKDLLSALSYVHKSSACHGSLSFSDIIFSPVGSSNILKVVGLTGNQTLIDKKSPTLRDVIFYSPEAAANTDNSAAANDVWACGIICCTLLTGLVPFTVKPNIEDTLKEIKGCKIDIDTLKDGPWKKVSLEAKQFLVRMLTKDPSKRSTAGALLYDKWLTTAAEAKISAEEFKGFCKQLLQMKGMTSMQNAMLYYMMEKAKTSSLQAKAAPLFKELNKSGTGKITKAEFVSVLEKVGINTKAEAEKIFSGLDLTGDGSIDYTEMMSAFFGKELIKNEENLKIAFDHLDVDKSGDLDIAEITSALGGSDKGGETAKKIAKELAAYKDKKVKYPEFLELMKKLA